MKIINNYPNKLLLHLVLIRYDFVKYKIEVFAQETPFIPPPILVISLVVVKKTKLNNYSNVPTPRNVNPEFVISFVENATHNPSPNPFLFCSVFFWENVKVKRETVTGWTPSYCCHFNYCFMQDLNKDAIEPSLPLHVRRFAPNHSLRKIFVGSLTRNQIAKAIWFWKNHLGSQGSRVALCP